MIFSTDGFEHEMRMLKSYGVEKAMLPVRKVIDLINCIDVFSSRLRRTCNVKEGDEIRILKKEPSNLPDSVFVQSLFIDCQNGHVLAICPQINEIDTEVIYKDEQGNLVYEWSAESRT